MADSLELIARAVIVDNGQLLLARARGADNTFLPGGHAEPGESLTAAVVREVREELGVECVVGPPAGVVEHRWHDGARDRYEANHAFVATLSGAATSREAGLTFEWRALADLDEANLQPAPMRAIARLVAAGGAAEAARVHECTFAAPGAVVVRRIRADDVERLRAARLYALAETPLAFGATLARDLASTDEAWRAWAEQRSWRPEDTRPRATFVVDDGSTELRGTITVVVDAADALVLAMWVHASYRGTDVATRVLQEALAWARGQGCTRATLHVTTPRGRRFYERRGFVATGVTVPLAHTPTVLEHEMALAL
jgi:8-oxo-dGTP pyrophosphatase MutT (NUDIX family)/GNAT superfamily N-acetyltransferase